MRLSFFTVLILIVSLLSYNALSVSNQTSPDTGQIPPSTIILVYIIGSTLEADPATPDYQGATKDIKEMIEGYAGGDERLRVYVAYGGARKEGWVGVTYATLEQLQDDMLENGVIGDANLNIYHNAQENMADPKTLSSFINYVRLLEPDGRRLIFFWDHGEAWNGFGIDTNFGNDRLTLEELNTALSEAKQRFEIIGFDACLMANLEVAQTLSPYGSILVASEDLEPGFGWDWNTVFKTLVQNPEIDPKVLSRTIVDAYFDNPYHTDAGKTMSALDLTKTSDVTSAFETLNREMSGGLQDEIIFNKISKAILKLSPFNQMITKSGELAETSVDLQDMVNQVSASHPGYIPYTSQVNVTLNSFILYNRQDGSRPVAFGVSIYSPFTAILADEKKAEKPPKIFSEFEDFLQTFIYTLKRSHLTSQIKDDKSGYVVPEGEIVDVRLTFIQKGDTYDIILGEEPAYPDKPGHYPLPAWGGWGLQWKDTESDNRLPVPVYFMGYTDKGRERYKAYAKVVRDNSEINLMFDLYYNPVNGEVTYYMLPYFFDESGHAVVEKKVFTLLPGDSLTMIAKISHAGEEKEAFVDYGSIPWSGSMVLEYDMLPCDTTYSMEFTVYNVAKKVIFSDETELTYTCSDTLIDKN